jgi:hypothetical protein
LAPAVERLYRGQVIETMPRLRGEADHRFDYRHIIGSLVRKPGAFARWFGSDEPWQQLARHSVARAPAVQEHLVTERDDFSLRCGAGSQ